MKPAPSRLGEYRFTFAIIADTHLNQSDHECNSPFQVNLLANNRLRYVINDINQRRPQFIIHLGDVVHPVPSMAELYRAAAAQFWQQCESLQPPLYIIPGNHDVGDKPLRWGPAGTVRQSFLDAWSKYFGDHYFSFEHRDNVFIGINAQVVNSGLPLEAHQAAWLSQQLAASAGKSIYLFTHYPPYLTDIDEPEHYDNLSRHGRQWLLDLLANHKVNALFAGHVHHFWYNRYADCHCYLLPSTCFTRQDYSEMFRVAPEAEYGRNDADKLGYFLVHVHAAGHDVEMVRCFGRQLTPQTEAAPHNYQRLRTPSPQTNPVGLLGFDLRQDWSERVQIPPSGGLDEFDRKWVRNDYGLLALWEMGITQLRIPLAEFSDARRLQRLRELAELGFKYTLYSFGLPSAAEQQLISDNLALLNGWEIAWPLPEIAELKASLKAGLPALRDAGLTLYFSPLRTKQEVVATGKPYFHVINHGLLATEPDLTQKLDNITAPPHSFDGVVFRCGLDEDVWQTARVCADIEQARGCKTHIQLRLSGDNPAGTPRNAAATSQRIAEAMFASWALHVPGAYCDTLADNDRGYFPRNGLLDRRFNPRRGYFMVKALHALLAAAPTPQSVTRDPHPQHTLYTAHYAASTQSFIIFNAADAQHQAAVVKRTAAKHNAQQVSILNNAGKLTIQLANPNLAECLQDCLVVVV